MWPAHVCVGSCMCYAQATGYSPAQTAHRAYNTQHAPYMQNVARVAVVEKIWWLQVPLSLYNHNPHFPYLLTHHTFGMSICLVGESLIIRKLFMLTRL